MAKSLNARDGSLSDTLLTDMQSLNRFKTEEFRRLTSIVLEFFKDPSKDKQLLDQVEEFAQEHGVSANALNSVVHSLLSIPANAVKKNVSQSQFQEDLINLGLSEDKAAVFAEQWSKSLLGVARTALGHTLVVNQLADMEWTFAVTAASSDVNQVGDSFLQLKLVINKGNKLENVYMELSLSQFYDFLHEMEKAKASLEYIS